MRLLSPARPTTQETVPRKRFPLNRVLAATLAVLLAALVALGLYRLLTPSWQTVWSDDFDGPAGSAPSARNWIVDTGTAYPGGAPAWGTGEVQTYTKDPANLALDGDGRLRITATRDAGGAWRSGRVETQRTDFQAPAGGALKVEARIKLPDGGQGYWPAFWMLGEGFRGNPTNWPMAGELDILENVGREPSTVHGTLHCGTAPGGPCFESNGIGNATSLPDGSHLSEEFHDYALEWDRSTSPEELRWYLDGTLYATVKATAVDATTWQQATHHGFFVLLNVAVGGGWPGIPDATTRPGRSMLVDHVTVSQR